MIFYVNEPISSDFQNSWYSNYGPFRFCSFILTSFSEDSLENEKKIKNEQMVMPLVLSAWIYENTRRQTDRFWKTAEKN